jgi:hypothetical protein
MGNGRRQQAVVSDEQLKSMRRVLRSRQRAAGCLDGTVRAPVGVNSERTLRALAWGENERATKATHESKSDDSGPD